ncbi:MAG: hypothetical protein P4L36_08670 [Holophaga sp.]|nr:hypothetical protein [Holophaga sp.]
MSSVLNVTATPSLPPVAPTPKPQAAAAAATTTATTTTTTTQPTLTQLMEEPTYQLTQQAQAGNQLAIQVLAQEQAGNAPLTTSAAASGGVNIIA